MNRSFTLPIFLLTLALATLALTTPSRHAAPAPSRSDEFMLDVPTPPRPVPSHGQKHLAWELHFAAKAETTVSQVTVRIGDRILAEHHGEDLIAILDRPYDRYAEVDEPLTVRAGERVAFFLWLSVDDGDSVPERLDHQITVTPSGKTAPEVLPPLTIDVDQRPPLVISPPLVGSGWGVAGGLANHAPHRRSIYMIDDKPYLAQRYAIDWGQFGADGLLHTEEKESLEAWYGYGEPLVAVADAVVTQILDGLPQSVPLSIPRDRKFSRDTIGGNYVGLDLGNGVWAYYAHLQPGSLRVKPGQKVRRGDVLGLLGNSGRSSAPHLHFHLVDADSLLEADGLPYVFDAFEHQGDLDENFDPVPSTKTVRRTREMPKSFTMVGF